MYRCPVCEYRGLIENPVATDGDILSTYEICACGGFEFGVTDLDQGVSIERWRQKWIANGAQFKHESELPGCWNPLVQLQLVAELSALPLVSCLEERDVRKLLLEYESGADVITIAKQFNIHPNIVEAYAAQLSPKSTLDQ